MTLLLPDPRPRMGLEVVVLAGARDARAPHAALKLVQDAGGGSRSAQAVDEGRGRSIHALCLENAESSVNTVYRVRAGPEVVQRDRSPLRGSSFTSQPFLLPVRCEERD